MLLNLGLLALFCLARLGLCQTEECFVPGECLSSISVGGNEASTKEDCLSLCKNIDGKKLMFYNHRIDL